MQTFTHKPETSRQSDKNVKVLLLDTPGKQAKIGIMMPAKSATTESNSIPRELTKQ